MLCAEFRKYSLDRGWYFYPDALPDEAVEKGDVRNGRIDRKLSFPLEDLYGDGRPAGKVGQEIYGCGGAFLFAARAFHRREGAPFVIFTACWIDSENPAGERRCWTFVPACASCVPKLLLG